MWFIWLHFWSFLLPYGNLTPITFTNMLIKMLDLKTDYLNLFPSLNLSCGYLLLLMGFNETKFLVEVSNKHHQVVINVCCAVWGKASTDRQINIFSWTETKRVWVQLVFYWRAGAFGTGAQLLFWSPDSEVLLAVIFSSSLTVWTRRAVFRFSDDCSLLWFLWNVIQESSFHSQHLTWFDLLCIKTCVTELFQDCSIYKEC